MNIPHPIIFVPKTYIKDSEIEDRRTHKKTREAIAQMSKANPTMLPKIYVFSVAKLLVWEF